MSFERDRLGRVLLDVGRFWGVGWAQTGGSDSTEGSCDRKMNMNTYTQYSMSICSLIKSVPSRYSNMSYEFSVSLCSVFRFHKFLKLFLKY